MQILRWIFKVLAISGCWVPPSWSSWKKQVYDVYTIFVFLVVHTFTLSQLLDIILIVENIDEFTDNFYILIAMTVACLKMNSLLINRNNIRILSDTLNKEPCKPKNKKELKIQARFEEVIESNIIYLTFLVQSAVAGFTLISLFTGFSGKELTFRGWIPYNYSSWVLFYPTYFHQILSGMVAALISIGYDGLICGLFVHTCIQMEILEYRLHESTRNKSNGLRNCVQHHNSIYKFAAFVNEKFKFTLFMQFISSMLVVCFNLYQLARSKPLSAKFMQLIIYMSCMLFQIFFYCWYGNEVKIKSQQIREKIFESEWLSLSYSTKKILLVIMRRAMIPIEFTSMYVVTVNLDTFLSLLKTSYSVYNLLQQNQISQEQGRVMR